MLNLKKICYFITGLVFIPLVFSAICAFITTSDYEDNIDFFWGDVSDCLFIVSFII